MHRIVRPQTWPSGIQLGVLTLTTATCAVLVTQLAGGQASATTTHPAVLAGLAGMAGLACSVWRALLQQSKRVSTLVQHIALSQPVSASTGAPPDTREQTGSGLRDRMEHTLSLLQGQGAHLAESTSMLDKLSVSIQQAAENAARSAAAAEQALMHAQQGTAAMHNTVPDLQHLGTQVRDVAKRLQHLEEHAQTVEKMGQEISELADGTNVLALNVSVQAGRADVAGYECAGAAEEVQHLSARTTEATRRITHLVHAMQRDTHAMALELEEHTHQIAPGVQAVAQAGEALHALADVSAHLAALIQSIRLETTQQACNTITLSKAMAGLSAVTHQAVVETQQAVAVCDELLSLSRH